MPAYIYHILHIVGILMIFMGYGALIARSLSGSDNACVKKLGSITSGIGLLIVFIAGFGLISKMGYSFTEGWILVKMAIWLGLGALIAVINRKADCACKLWWVLLILGIIAAVMVYAKPF